MSEATKKPPIHPEDLTFHAEAQAQFKREFEAKFTEGAARYYSKGPFMDGPKRIEHLKEEILDQWSYTIRLEKRDHQIAQRLHAFITRVPLSPENRGELEGILYEVLR